MKKEKRLILLIAVLATAAVIIFLLTQNKYTARLFLGKISSKETKKTTIHLQE